MIYTVGMKEYPVRNVSPDIGDVLSVVLPNGGRRYFRAISGAVHDTEDRCSDHCPMVQHDVLIPGRYILWNICGYAEFACCAESRDYHWEEVPIEAIMEELI